MTSVFKQAATQSLAPYHKVSSVQSIEARIRAQVWKKQIRIKTFFEDYDKLRKGHCIDDKFKSAVSAALSFLNIHLDLQEIKALEDKYRMEPGDLIKYSQFVANIDQQFGNTELAKTNLSFLKQNGGVGEGESKLQQLLDYIRWAIKSKRIFVKPPLQDYDRTKSNLVTRQQFIRVLDNLGLVKNQELADLLSKKYARSSNPKQICYQDFIRDIEDVNAVQALAVKGMVPNPSVVDPNKHITLDLHKDSLTEEFYVKKRLPERAQPIKQLLKKIQAEVTLKRLRIRQFFLDFDGLRKNIVTGQQFRRIVGTLNLNFSQNQYKELIKVYGIDPVNSREERIKWMDFCEDVDKVFTIKQLEKDPLCRVGQIQKSVFEPVKHSALSFTQQQNQQLESLLRGYQQIITTKRLHLKPQFEDFDITKIGYVTKNQFCRILKQFDLTPPTESLYNLLLKKYMDKSNLDQVNYYQFIRDVDRYGQIGLNLSKNHTNRFADYKYKPRQSKATIRFQAPDDLTDLLARLRRTVREKRIRVSDFMRDFDKLRHGNITKEQFRLTMNMAMLPLSEQQFQQIVKGFACENKQGYIRWKDFCDCVDEVFGAKELEKVAPNQPIPHPSTKINYGRRGISAEELALANKIKADFKQYQLINRLDTKQMFQNWDKLNRWKVSAKQFRQVLATIGFNLSEQENKAICKLYASDDQDQSQVLYLEFLKDTKPYDFSYMTVIKEEVKRGTGERKAIPDNVQKILQQLRKTTKLNRLRYREYFQDFDGLRKGNTKKNKFRSVIFQTMKIPLDERYFTILQNYYGQKHDPTMVNYVRFCDDLDIVFNLPDHEKEPTMRPQQFSYTSISATKKDGNDIESLMTRLGQVTRKHRILLKPFFQDKDIAKIGRVSFTRMRSILDNNKIPLTDGQFETLCKSYSYEGIQFNYLDFIESLKQYQGYEE